MSQELIVIDNNFMPALSVPQAIQRFNTLVEFVQNVMREGVDYGKVPNTDKNTLMKAGAEKLTTLFGLTVRFQVVEQNQDWAGDMCGEPFFYYWYRCQLWRGDLLIAEADGSCNSRESKYRWRWVSAADVPQGIDTANLVKRGGTISEFVFAVDKAETGGKYGKPLEYWQAFQTAIENGTARAIKKKIKSGEQRDAWEIDSTLYRVPNDDIASLVNTIQKMAQKRALVAATLIGCNASEFFTQDLDEVSLAGDGATYAPPAQQYPPAPPVNTVTDEVIDQPKGERPLVTRLREIVTECRAASVAVPSLPKPKDMRDEELEKVIGELEIELSVKYSLDGPSDDDLFGEPAGHVSDEATLPL